MADFDRFVSNDQVHYKLKDGLSGLMSATDIYSDAQKSARTLRPLEL